MKKRIINKIHNKENQKRREDIIEIVKKLHKIEFTQLKKKKKKSIKDRRTKIRS